MKDQIPINGHRGSHFIFVGIQIAIDSFATFASFAPLR
jgi:hypothetical protein